MLSSFIIFSFIVSPSFLYAQEKASQENVKAHRELVKKFLKTMHVKEGLKSNMKEMVKMQVRQNPNLKNYEDILIKFYSKYLSWESLKDDLINIYMEEFTRSDIEKLLDFYSTPVGQKASKKMPALFQKGAQLGVQKIQNHISELQRMIQEKARENMTPQIPSN